MATSDFKAFDLPLAKMFKEKFNQPIFGANYLSCISKPLFDQLPADAYAKIWFMEGGCGKFLKCFRYTIGKLREASGRPELMHALQAELQSQRFQEQFAYFDPNDPSTIYVSQPPVMNHHPVMPGMQANPPPPQPAPVPGLMMGQPMPMMAAVGPPMGMGSLGMGTVAMTQNQGQYSQPPQVVPPQSQPNYQSQQTQSNPQVLPPQRLNYEEEESKSQYNGINYTTQSSDSFIQTPVTLPPDSRPRYNYEQ